MTKREETALDPVRVLTASRLSLYAAFMAALIVLHAALSVYLIREQGRMPDRAVSIASIIIVVIGAVVFVRALLSPFHKGLVFAYCMLAVGCTGFITETVWMYSFDFRILVFGLSGTIIALLFLMSGDFQSEKRSASENKREPVFSIVYSCFALPLVSHAVAVAFLLKEAGRMWSGEQMLLVIVPLAFGILQAIEVDRDSGTVSRTLKSI